MLNTMLSTADNDTRSRFWATYNKESSEFDDEFLGRYKGDMDIVLIASGLFSTVSTSFIVSLEPSLGPDPTETTNALLKLLIHTIDNSTFSGHYPEIPGWNGPDDSVIWIQSIMYASLAASLLAAVGAMLGKQWLSHYKRFGRGSIDSRGRRRQRKLDGLKIWHFEAVLDILPVLLQLSLLFFGIALAAYLWTQQKTIASVVIGAVGFGVLFYIAIVVSSLVYPTCPYQTPTSNVLSALGLSFCAGSKSLEPLIHRIISAFPIQFCSNPSSGLTLSNSTQTLKFSVEKTPTPKVSLDAPSVLWVLETSTDPDILTAAARMVIEIEWPLDLDVSGVLVQLRDTFLRCFEGVDSRQPQLLALGRDRAFACGRALLHLYFERNSVQDKRIPPLFRESVIAEYDAPHLPRIEWLNRSSLQKVYQQDTEFGFICNMLVTVFALSSGPSSLPNIVNISEEQLSWFSHSLLHCLCDSHLETNAKYIVWDVISRLLSSPLPTSKVLADCVLAAGLLIGVPVERTELVRYDKSYSVSTILKAVLYQISAVLRFPDDQAPWLDERSILALRILLPLSQLYEMAEFRSFFFGPHTPARYLQLSGMLVQLAIRPGLAASIEEHGLPLSTSDIWIYARTTLHYAIVTSENKFPRSDAIERMWRLDALKSKFAGQLDYTWLFDLLAHFRDPFDEVAIADALLTFSVLPDLSNHLRHPGFLDTIIWAMSPDMPIRVRHAAMKVVHEVKEMLSEYVTDTPVLAALSSGLRSAAFPNVSASKTDNLSPPDDFLYGWRDLHYLHIVYAFARHDQWCTHLLKDGHFERCNALALALQHAEQSSMLAEQQSAYLVAIFQIGSSEHMMCLDNSVMWLLVHNAWRYILFGLGFLGSDVHNILAIAHPITECTIVLMLRSQDRITEQLKEDIRRSFTWMKGPMQVHQQASMIRLLQCLEKEEEMGMGKEKE